MIRNTIHIAMLITGPPVNKKYLIIIMMTGDLPQPKMRKCLNFIETRERGNCTWRNKYKPKEKNHYVDLSMLNVIEAIN
jgi:hypothetical protein